ncbi:SDR family oxidoreductase [Myxococcus sp. CA051A]|uniref:SDR family oxidoreductase n=1 Tax=Myxococcus llanfairpwllgwyngyllgogerychwyrndrobwllllantysiliogogogochensis TaxID=2590453 RepID=A0A540WTS0_9BACT|nr:MULTISPECIES: SDR family oxidoreductase [Myxococcus]NTX10734.1 SDR family oxidoreductase [Myxococcus sp. CA056]NTX37386.1 SDR family oxidoreductase [Myxococcus sp. CA033]NTX56801.1 SDR family oxidoreductase [Myxococcus sp. CA039A]NTX66069.1 SDR family oxidoreductase [Myxococcus sp. CA051A]TQF12411.1 SDR family oxidoreductase [Myxococcus llanfairpwllgwyngyllgogerychwyrndrobwllllantysiliogogogochensis]
MSDSEEERGKGERPWALILGASSGTGAAIANAVARKPGLDVFGVHRGRYVDNAALVERQVKEAGRRALLWQADASTPEAAEAGVQALREVAGPRSVKLFVHSIAGASVGRFLSEGEDRLHARRMRRTFDTMAHSFVYWAQALVAEDMLAPDARLLGLQNSLDETHLSNTALISASKAALEMYVRYLAMELGGKGHRVNLLKFGTVLTPALKHVYSPEALVRLEAAHARMNPAGRMCTVEEVANFVGVLTGDEAGWFNGATIDFTGGMTLRLLDLVLNP